MKYCPICGSMVPQSDNKQARCAACGTRLDADSGKTVDLTHGQPTVDSDSIDFDPLKPTPPGSATVDLSKLQQTVNSDSFPTDPRSPSSVPGGATVELTPGSPTVDSDSIDFDPLKPTSSGKATVELEHDSRAAGESTKSPSAKSDRAEIGSIEVPAIDSRSALARQDPGKPMASDSSVIDARIDQTIDSVDIPSPPVNGHQTVADCRLDVTIDSVEFVPPGGGTVEQQPAVSHDPPRRTDTGTVQDREINQTLDSVDLHAATDKKRTVGEVNVKATVDSVQLDQPQEPRTVPDRDVLATYDSADVSSRDARQMDQMWRGANVEKASPRMTIKGREDEPHDQKSTLVIQARQFRDPNEDSVRVVNADYDLIKKLGQGGMGVVYWARQASIDRNVAVKMLKPEMARDGAQRSKFLAEAVITGDLDHPNIVPIYELGKNSEGALFYAMKKVQGTPWDRAIQEKTQSENIEILMKVADAVAFAHNRFVVHRDLKPENIMLGEFGEVLVMDWGLALPFGKFEKSRSIQPSVSMGGTPAYMAPEMATGPFQKIAPTSDIYLLGAILFEIVAGKPPHTGRDVMKCLFAAAKNDIQPTEKTGELVNIALKAMATQQADRFQTVQAFQQAIRDYEAHSASIAMASRAADTLRTAEQSNQYDHYATAVFEYQEALKLWIGNDTAAKGIPSAKLAYANNALKKGDLDLAESLLDLNDPSHADGLSRIEAAKHEREAKLQRLKAARRAVRSLAAAVFLAVTTGLIAVGYQTIQVSRQRDLAVSNEQRAQVQEQLAKSNEQTAIANAQEARLQKSKAEENATEAQRQEMLAKDNADTALRNAAEADRQRTIAVTNETEAKRQEKIAVTNAAEAKRQQEIAEYEAYVALIGLAAAKIEENAFGYARVLLEQCRPELRNWEWGRLMHLCQQSVRDFAAGSPVDSIAVSPDGKRFATGGWNGNVRIWNVADGSVAASIPHGGLYAYDVAFSRDGKYLATGSSDRAGYLRVWDAESGDLIRVLDGHTDGVLSVTFSRDGTRLLSTSYDNTARLWDFETGKLIRTYLGHSWWVWDADFSPDGQQIVTASQDGTALVWNTETGQHGPPFMGHQGPVYAACFSADGEFVATGGYDRRVLRWRPNDVTPFDFRALVATGDSSTARYQEFAGHQAAVRGVSLSPDGLMLVSCGHDNTVRVWNSESGDLIKILRGHDSWVRACTFLPDGRQVLSAGHDQYARLWDVEGYAESRVLQSKWLRGHDDAVMAVGFSADGTQIVTASRDRTARSWNAKTGSAMTRFTEGHSFLASSAGFSPDGKRLFTSAVDGTTRGWDMATGVQQLRLDNTGMAAALAISHDGRWLLTGGNRVGDVAWRAQLWNAVSGEPVHELAGHASEVTAVTFSPDDRFCYSGDANGRGVIWDTRSGKEIRQLQWHTSKIAAATFLEDGSRLLTASDDKTVAQWDTSRMATDPAAISVNTQWTLKHSDSVLSLDVVSSRNLAITCTLGGEVSVWDVARATLLRSLPVGKTNVNSVSLSRDGRLALTVHPDNDERQVRLWDVASGRELRVPSPSGEPGPFLDLKASGGLVWSAYFSPASDTVVTVGGNEARMWNVRAEMPGQRELMSFSPHAAVASVAYSHDGSRVITGSWDNSARIWDARTGQAQLKLANQHTLNVNSVVFSPDDRFVLTASDDRTVKLWDAKTGHVIRSFNGHRGAVRSAVFSTQGTRILTASDDKTARIWDVETGALVRQFSGHEWGVLHAVFSPDGSRIITGSDDNTAIVWDAATGTAVWKLAGHTAAVTAVAFAPDGQRVLTASEDFTAKLWDTDNGKEVLNLKGHSQELTSIAFSPDGRYALTGSRDGTAIMWLTTSWDKPSTKP